MHMDINSLYNNNYIDHMDWAFARTIQRLGHCGDPWVALAAALVCRAAADGHVCLDLTAAQGQGVPGIDAAPAGPDPITPDQWRRRLADCAAVGAPGAFRPLILHGHRLYLHRYWTWEQEVAQAILKRCTRPAKPGGNGALEAALARLFPDGDRDQRRAARLAVTRRFGVISGGPGTGKTHTVARIIVLLQAICAGNALKIHLAAPTGKAAARLQEAVRTVLESGGAMLPPAPAMVQEARTLHRLLGYMPGTARFRYGAGNPLPADVVIVDEASMIDLALMHQLMKALAEPTRLVLVGDKDQLASVEAGAVLGDICHGISRAGEGANGGGANGSAAGLRDHIVVLDRSYRFDARSGIGALSRAINAGDAARVLSLLGDGRDGAIGLNVPTDWGSAARALEPHIVAAFDPLFDGRGPGDAFEALRRFKILCAVRQGPFGVEALNRFVEQVLRKHGRIPPAAALRSPWYPGRPVMVTRNDYYQGLFNGDVGIAMDFGKAAGQSVRVAFAGNQGDFKWLAPHQLPEHQTVFAMTVHKSQGSEFDHVMLMLPDRDAPVLTRELIYTAVTRARRSIQVWADPRLLARAVERRTHRASGLRDALWPA